MYRTARTSLHGVVVLVCLGYATGMAAIPDAWILFRRIIYGSGLFLWNSGTDECRALYEGDIAEHGAFSLDGKRVAFFGPGGVCTVNNDGTVDLMDILDVLAAWGTCP